MKQNQGDDWEAGWQEVFSLNKLQVPSVCLQFLGSDRCNPKQAPTPSACVLEIPFLCRLLLTLIQNWNYLSVKPAVKFWTS